MVNFPKKFRGFSDFVLNLVELAVNICDCRYLQRFEIILMVTENYYLDWLNKKIALFGSEVNSPNRPY